MKWTDKDIVALQGPETNQALVERLGRSYEAIHNKRRRLGLPIPEGSTRGMGRPKQPKAPKKLEDTLKLPAKDLPKATFGHLPLEVVDHGEWIQLGLVGDTHLCCKEERLAELHNFYDLMEREGIRSVLHAGNIVDGYIQKINGDSVYSNTVDGQCQYVVDNYPKRKNIITNFITGDDHEGWWTKSSGLNFGAYLAMLAKEQGRDDLKYIGHVEADVEVRSPGRKGLVSTMVKVQHPGGGSAYSRSYTGQKTCEAFEGGEKPDILVQGHYHVSNYMNERNVHVISLPGWQDQTIFARKKRLRMEIGGVLLRFKVNPDNGSVTRCCVEFVRYFTRGFYKPYMTSDRKILNGHLVLTE